MKIFLIRHGQTKGNIERRYVGVTDECLTEEGRKLLFLQKEKRQKDRAEFIVEGVYSSPRKRCIETANILYKSQIPELVEDFAECDFGIFEYKNYVELQKKEAYQRWLDSGGIIGFPKGETREEFQLRSLRGMETAVAHALSQGYKSIAFVVHGGTIMSVLDKWAEPHQEFYKWQVGNGCGYILTLEEKRWKNGERQLMVLAEIREQESL